MPARPLIEHVALNLRVPRGQDGYWSIIIDLGAGGRAFTLADVDGRTNAGRSIVADYVGRLVKGGWLEIVSTERLPKIGVRHTYRLARTARDAPRLRRDGSEYPETARDRMWRAMKMLDAWTPADLAAATETEALPPVALLTVKSYVWRLDAAGVVQKIDPGKPGIQATYRLLRNIGAAAPRILRTHLVFDPNSNTVLGPAEAEEV
jgi:hypothetical protein